MLQNELASLIENYKYLSERMHDLIQYLYENTEIFEKSYMADFPEELYRYFAGKITRHGNDMNKLDNLLSNKEKKQIQLIKLNRR